MKLTYKVLIDDKEIGVSDDKYGDEVMLNIYQRYGDMPVKVYDKNELWGNGGYVKPLYITTIKKLYREN